MRHGSKRWALVAGSLYGLCVLAGPAAAQVIPAGVSFGPQLGGEEPLGYPTEPQGGGGPPQEQSPPLSMKDDGLPNAWNDDRNCLPPNPCFWFNIAGALGWQNRAPLSVPLVTTSTAPNTVNNAGAIGQSATAVLLGQNKLVTNTFVGVRMDTGIDLQDLHPLLLPVEFSILYLHQHARSFEGNDPNGNSLLARPVQAANLGNAETVYLSSFPGFAGGSIDVNSSSQFWTWDLNFVGHTNAGDCQGGWCGSHFDLLGGFRYAALSEDLQISSTTDPLNPAFGVFYNGKSFGQGFSTNVNDLFKVGNHFYGGQLGARASWINGPWFCDVVGKCAIGVNNQAVTIRGDSLLLFNGTPIALAPGGILAVASNGVYHSRNVFSALPEGQVNVGLVVSQCLKLHIGYDVVYLTNVVRPGDQISRTVDTRQVPTDLGFNPNAPRVTQPAFNFHSTDFLLHTVNLGMTFTF